MNTEHKPEIDATAPVGGDPSGVRNSDTPAYFDGRIAVYQGDCLDVLHHLSDASIDAVVTDPPYNLTAGKKGGTGVASINLDSPYGRSRIGTGNGSGGFMGQGWDDYDHFPGGFYGWCEAWATECLRILKPGGHLLAFGGTRTFHRLACAIEDAGFEVRDSIAWLYGSGFPKSLNLVDESGERTGWGTALKPAHEPIVVARKPLAGTVAANVAQHGTGALNIEACRLSTDEDLSGGTYSGSDVKETAEGWRMANARREFSQPSGRWPSNVVLDEFRAAELDEQTGVLTSGKMRPTHTTAGRSIYGQDAAGGFTTMETYGDSGGASRFFYVAKARKDERPVVNGVAHPTVKPLALMRWLIRLVTPPGGTILEPFAGSGTTVEAAIAEDVDVVAIERDETYLPLILARIERQRAIQNAPREASLFDEESA